MKIRIYDEILEWKKYNGTTELRRKKGGKIYIAEFFAKENYKSYILIDFNKVSKSFLHTPYVIHAGDYREKMYQYI